MIREEVAETEGLEILSTQAGRIKVARGDFVYTGFGSYKITLKCQGIQEITESLAKHPLQEINQELRDTEMVGEDTSLLLFTGGGKVRILVGLQDVSLDPVLIGTLTSGL